MAVPLVAPLLDRMASILRLEESPASRPIQAHASAPGFGQNCHARSDRRSCPCSCLGGGTTTRLRHSLGASEKYWN
jgi:hypothetical protein